jgi:hypothetical protein
MIGEDEMRFLAWLDEPDAPGPLGELPEVYLGAEADAADAAGFRRIAATSPAEPHPGHTHGRASRPELRAGYGPPG